jgi:hypothetical protein
VQDGGPGVFGQNNIFTKLTHFSGSARTFQLKQFGKKIPSKRFLTELD